MPALRKTPDSRLFASVQEAGVDEAGRGCLAGPVAACAVILPPDYDLPGLGDSKTLSQARRETLAPAIRAAAVSWGLGVAWPRRIEAVNILQASLEAMSMAVSWLSPAPAKLLIDGCQTIPEKSLARFWAKRQKTDLPEQEAIVKGDSKIPAISAASILAKTWRDKLMSALAKKWPGYGFEKHKGYGTKEHLAALARLGPCPMHRATFRGVPRQEKWLSLWPQ